MGAGASRSSSPYSESTARLLRSTTIGKVRLYGANPAIIKALADTGVRIVIGEANGDIPSLASDPGAAARWVDSNILPFCPASNITLLTGASDLGDGGKDGGGGGEAVGSWGDGAEAGGVVAAVGEGDGDTLGEGQLGRGAGWRRGHRQADEEDRHCGQSEQCTRASHGRRA
ncbi:hypothetical protein NL676_030108 [Syzygium grande]|nr:hypothetical protein NL676_030108 [Syzygium grande]